VVAKIVRQTTPVGRGPVTYELIGSANAPTGARIRVDYSQAPVPEHFYVSDYFSIQNLDPQVLLVFGKLNTGGADKLRNKVEIYFPAHAFLGQFWRSSEEFIKNLRVYLEQKGFQARTRPVISEDVEKVQTFQSNLALVAQSGTDALIDFFYLSPTELLLKAPKGHNLQLLSLVRVILAPDLLLTFFDACIPIADKLAARYPEVYQEYEVALK
jgi:hypothetical protein